MTLQILAEAGDHDALIVGVYEGGTLSTAAEGLNTALGGLLTDLTTSGDLSGKAGSNLILYPRGQIPAKRLILVGLGKRDDFTSDSARRAGAIGAQKARDLKAGRLGLYPLGVEVIGAENAASASVEGALLGTYTYHGQKTTTAPEPFPTTLEVIAGVDQDLVKAGAFAGQIIAEAAMLARTLTNLPPNICTPEYLGETAQEMAAKVGLRVEVLHRTQIEALKMGALLAVARGSRSEPRFIILEHNAAQSDKLDTVVLVGKGITFDTGGYSIKTAEGMVGMKGDMAGGAAVIAAMQAVARLNLPLHVVGLVPTCDNRISDDAYVPQEVVTASNGMTIEIISTDAEGRLILADALVFAARYKPAAVVNIATLTGSKSIALGPAAAAFYSTDDGLRDKLIHAGKAVNELVWQMPLLPAYDKLLESKTADMKNTGGRFGGANIAAMFLKRFVTYPAWAHIDMAGNDTLDSSDVSYVPAGGTGFGARLFIEMLRRWQG
ncbi:MAG: leucyl aminopeptidase [Anaerolineae bacterium]|nr:leucyl aminopeptidase [Anaerolineae bacterium]